jgi:hypothetical protein
MDCVKSTWCEQDENRPAAVPSVEITQRKHHMFFFFQKTKQKVVCGLEKYIFSAFQPKNNSTTGKVTERKTWGYEPCDGPVSFHTSEKIRRAYLRNGSASYFPSLI